MIYAMADAAAIGLRLSPDEGHDMVRIGECIKAAAREQLPQSHPEHPEVVGRTIVSLVEAPSGPHADQRNAVVVSTGSLDWARPGTWTGALDPDDPFPAGFTVAGIWGAGTDEFGHG